jgi:4-amino-4-deoxy-L-arabinose transferase-like glycosyltransferase
VVILGFFSAAATKLPGYILPTIPAGSLLITFVFKPFESLSVSNRLLRPSIWFNCGLFGIVAAAACAQKLLIKPNKDYPNLAYSILASNSAVILFVTATAATLLLAWLATNPKRLQWAWAPNALGLLALLTTAVPVLTPIIDRERLLPVRQLAAIAGASAHANDSLVVVGFKRYSVLLYSQKPAIFANKPNQVINQIGSNDLRGSVLLLGTERELIRFGIHPTQCNAKDCYIIARKDSHLLLKSSIKSIQAINSAG